MTERQAKILAAIIEEHAELAGPVGSVTLAKLFNVSSATIRAEMAQLEVLGMIKQPHTSAGRVPTDRGYRWYVNSLSEGSPTVKQIEPNARALDVRIHSAGEPEQAIRSAVDSLVQLTDNAAIGTIGGQLYISGLSHLFGQPEFSGGNAVQEVAYLLDNLEPWLRETAPNKPISVFIGRENPIGKASGCTLVISKFRSPFSDNSYIGTVGPTRQNYRQVMGLVGMAGEMLEQELYV
ncbi:transcriptional regulator [Candidatus Nomurabacteria bacterium]|nr:transcriptional regulator [Candidatus Nomurabacteria bacterium]